MDMVINRAKSTGNSFIIFHPWDTGETFHTSGMKKFGKVI